MMLVFAIISISLLSITESTAVVETQDAITLTIVNDWQMNYLVKGLDVWEDSTSMGVAFCSGAPVLHSFDPITNSVSTLGPIDTLPGVSYGVGFNNNLSNPPIWIISGAGITSKK